MNFVQVGDHLRANENHPLDRHVSKASNAKLLGVVSEPPYESLSWGGFVYVPSGET